MIDIVLDTNLLKSGSTDFTIVQFITKVNDILDEIESNDWYEEVRVVIPQIVVDELFEHQKKAYHDKFASIKSCKFPTFEVKAHENYDAWLSSMFEQALSELKTRIAKCVIIPYPSNAVLPKIIQRAIAKIAPFEGKEKESDKGFKDVIIWESTLEYKRLHPVDTIVLCSRDGKVCDKSLKAEFESLFSDQIYQIKLEKDDGNKPIYDLIATLTDSEQQHLTFSERLKQETISLLNEDFLSALYIGSKIQIEDNTFYCEGVSVIGITISNIEDIPNENKRISIYANVIVDLKYIDDSGEGQNAKRTYQFIIEYSFETSLYYLMEYELDGELKNIRNLGYILNQPDEHE